MASSINHIFFPTDFSKNAERALPFAAEIAQKFGAKLTLFHASQDTMDLAPNFEETRKKTIQEANNQFDALLAILKENDLSEGLNISTVLQSGETVTNLLSQMDEQNADLVVMGTKGATGDRNALFGSVATSMIKKSPVPVLAVPNGSTFDQFKNIIFTTDYKEGDIAALSQTIDLAKQFNSNVDVVHINEQEGFESEIKFRGFRELVKSKIDYEKLNFHLKYEYDFFPGMADYIIEAPTSLLVMVRHKKTFWEKLFERDHSKEMAFYSKVPLLVLPELFTKVI
ncbi:MAG: universal stress protein [Balneolaceae bacterium]|nr:universal stress protein [Balneolaceae bacterium]